MSQPQTPNDDEQYRIASGLYDNELGRFYNRQTLYLGLQLAAFAGLFAAIDQLAQTPALTRLVGLVMLAVSILTILIVTAR